MKKKPEITIADYYDGFAIYIGEKRFHFDQEDTREELVDMFKELGFESKYEEVY